MRPKMALSGARGAKYVALLIAFIIADRIASIAFPYHMLLSDTPSERASIAIKSLVRASTYYKLTTLVGLVLIISVAVIFYRARVRYYVQLIYCFVLGFYISLMLDTNLVGSMHGKLDEAMAHGPAGLTSVVSGAFPLVIVFAVPWIVAYAISVGARKLRSRDAG